ncbi:30S ribosomal protein S5 [Candidatus Peregrinibacteria bacterium]|nr:MAG: 30S ribosomal protein S5 [Candidatus Peregrinibacteria bacterium]
MSDEIKITTPSGEDLNTSEEEKGVSSRGGKRGKGERSGGKGRKRNRREGGEREAKEFEEELLQVDRVTRVVKGGRRLRFRATVVIGDRKGRVGFGTDKAAEVPQAIQKAVRDAKKNLITVPMVNGTIPHQMKVKFKSAKILIMPAKSGSGIIAGGAMRKIADLAGIEDILGKNIGTSNRISSGKAMMIALKNLSQPKEEKKEFAKETVALAK